MKKYSKSYVLTITGNALMIVGALVFVVSLFLTSEVKADTILIAVGCAIVALAFGITLARVVPVLFSKINHRSPQYKDAIINTVIAGICFALAVFGFIFAIASL
jgi:hypothetical protein